MKQLVAVGIVIAALNSIFAQPVPEKIWSAKTINIPKGIDGLEANFFAVDKAEGKIYVAHDYFHQSANLNGVLQYNGYTQNPTNTELFGYGICAGKQGRKYVHATHSLTCYNNTGDTLWRLNSGAGSQPGQFNKIFCIATDKLERIFVLEDINNRISVIDKNGAFVKHIPYTSSASCNTGPVGTPYCMKIDNQNNFWIADWGCRNISIYDSSMNFVKEFAPLPADAGQLQRISSFDFGNNGKVYAASADYDGFGNLNTAHQRIVVFDSTTGNYLTHFGSFDSLKAGKLHDAKWLACDAQSNVYVYANMLINKFDANGNFIAAFGADGINGELFEFPGSFGTLNGNVVVTTKSLLDVQTQAHFLVFDSNHTVIGKRHFLEEQGYDWAELNGKAYTIGSPGANNLGRVFSYNNFFGARTQLNTGGSATVDVTGFGTNLFLLKIEQSTEAWRKFSLVSNTSTTHGNNYCYGDGCTVVPSGIAVNSMGELYISDAKFHQIHVFDTLGNFLRRFGRYGVAGNEAKRPYQLAIDGFDNVWICDTIQSRIKIYDRLGNYKTMLEMVAPGDELGKPYGIHYDATTKRMYVADAHNHRVIVYRIDQSFKTDLDFFSTGIDPDGWTNFFVYPNPVQQEITVESPSPIISAQLYDLNGRSYSLENTTGNKLRLAENIVNGLYVLRVETANGYFTTKLIKE